jgi:hypothetical protein
MPSLIGISHVERQRKHGVAETFLQIGKVCHCAGGSRNLIAARECGFGPDAAEAARGAGDKPDFARHSILLRTSIIDGFTLVRFDRHHRREPRLGSRLYRSCTSSISELFFTSKKVRDDLRSDMPFEVLTTIIFFTFNFQAGK